MLANATLFVLLLLHDADHVLLQEEPTGGPGGVPWYGWAVSFAGYAALAAAVLLARRGDRRALRLTLAMGTAFVLGFVVSHALPVGPGSYWDYEPGALSWALIVAPVIAGIAAAALTRRVALRAR